MKKIYFIILAAMVFNSCDVVDSLTKFDMDYNASVVIESTANANLPFDLITPDIQTNSESEFALNDTRKDLIEEIRVKQLTLVITAPQGEDFSFLESIEIFIIANGLPEEKVAWSEDPLDNTTGTLELSTSDKDFQEYIKKDQFSLKLTTITDEILTKDYQIEIQSVFFVDAKILGI